MHAEILLEATDTSSNRTKSCNRKHSVQAPIRENKNAQPSPTTLYFIRYVYRRTERGSESQRCFGYDSRLEIALLEVFIVCLSFTGR